MHCLRCKGLMIATHMRDPSSPDIVSGWRCLLCGETTDPGIEANRVSHCHPAQDRARVPGTPRATSGKRRV